MKKTILSFVSLFCLTVISFAQNVNETVYLKNGSVIKGVIVEQIPNKSLKIQTADENLFVYNLDEVEKITKEVQQESNTFIDEKFFEAVI